MPALDALTTRLGFLAQVHHPDWMRYLDGYAASLRGEIGDSLPSDFFGSDVTGQKISKVLLGAAQMAHTYYVSPTMEVLVTAASHDWPEEEPVREDDFPQPQGWLWIPGGITTVDVHGRLQFTNAVLWDCYGGGVDVHLLSDIHNPNDALRVLAEKEKENWRIGLRLTPWDHIRMSWGDRIPRGLMLGNVVPPEIADQIKVTREGDRVVWYLPEGWSPQDMVPHTEQMPNLTWLLSCLRIMQQPLAEISTVGMPAHLRNQWKRKVKIRNSLVTVIEYRRRQGEYEHDTGRTLTHRYFRRGHWRRVWYKNDEGQWDRRATRIQPQIVGDPKLPLRLREHVNSLIR